MADVLDYIRRLIRERFTGEIIIAFASGGVRSIKEIKVVK